MARLPLWPLALLCLTVAAFASREGGKNGPKPSNPHNPLGRGMGTITRPGQPSNPVDGVVQKGTDESSIDEDGDYGGTEEDPNHGAETERVRVPPSPPPPLPLPPGKPPNPSEQSKQGNLKNCFTEKNRCFVGDNCIEDILVPNLTVSGVHKSMRQVGEKEDYNPERIKAIESCNVGAIFTPKRKTQYNFTFEYRTTESNTNLEIAMEDSVIWVGAESGDIFCEPNCRISLNMKKSQRFGSEKFFTGEVAFKIKIPNLPDAKSIYETGDSEGGSPKLAVEQSAETSTAGAKEQRKEDGMDGKTLGTILIVCGAVLVAFIIIAVIVGTVMQRRHAAKNARRRAAIAAKSRTAASKGRSVESTTRTERTPMIRKKTTTTTSSGRASGMTSGASGATSSASVASNAASDVASA